MADEQVVISLTLDKKDFDKSLKELAKDAMERGEDAGVEFSKGVQSGVKKGARSAGQIVKSSFANFGKFLIAPFKQFNDFLREDITGSILNLRNVLGAGLAGGFFLAKATKEASSFEKSLEGLVSVANRYKISTEEITNATLDLLSDGLIPVENITGSLKNLLIVTKGDLDETVGAFKDFRDIASFNTQGQLKLGDAIERASQGVKDLRSQVTDNIGATENLSRIQARYAKALGLTVNQLTEEQKRLFSLRGLREESQKFAGDFAKLQVTFAGATSRLSTVWNTFLIRIGQFITKSPLAIALINKISKFLGDITKEITAINKDNFLKDVINSIIDYALALEEYIITPTAKVFGVIELLVNGLVTGIQTVLFTIFKIGSALTSFLPKDNPIKKFVDDFSESSFDVLLDNFKRTQEAFDNLTSSETSEKFRELALQVRTAVNETAQAVADLGITVKESSDKVEEPFIRIAKTAKGSGQAIANSIKQSIGQTATAGIQQLTKALVLGEKGFDNFGKQIAGILGNMATQLGQTLLLTGIGMKSLLDLSGAQAIIAGAGLIALGTILKSFSGGEGGEGGASAGNAGLQAVGDTTASFVQDEPEEREEPSTQVVVNVQGDILDGGAETGQRLVDILNEAYDKQGVIINRGILG